MRLDVDAPPDLPHVSVDRSQIERAIGNLVTNAMRATPAGGTITVAAASRGDEVAISVTDTGAGIPRDTSPESLSRSCRCRTRPAAAPGSA